MHPSPNTSESINLRRIGICRFHSTGIGRVMIMMSMHTFIMLVASTNDMLLPQVPAKVWSQLLAKGLQIRN